MDENMPLESMSFTRLMDVEECPYRARLKYIDKVPEPVRLPPPGKAEHPMDRGSRIHEDAENVVRGLKEPTHELRKFEPELTKARELFASRRAHVEEMWGFDEHWQAVSGRPFLRIKADLTCLMNDSWALSVDHKTGSSRYASMKHAQQRQLYGVATFFKFDVVKVTTENWYLDEGKVDGSTLTQRQGVALSHRWMTRMLKAADLTLFHPRPSQPTCRFCPYNQQSGICKYAAV